jgi:hypothetical protein
MRRDGLSTFERSRMRLSREGFCRSRLRRAWPQVSVVVQGHGSLLQVLRHPRPALAACHAQRKTWAAREGRGAPFRNTGRARAALLSQLRPADRCLVERVLDNHPGVTAAEANEHLRAFGGAVSRISRAVLHRIRYTGSGKPHTASVSCSTAAVTPSSNSPTRRLNTPRQA